MTTYKLRGNRRAEAHPAADVFPMLGADELEALAADIRLRSQQSPVVLQKAEAGDYLVLDGRNRLLACEQLGVDPKVRHVDGSVDAVGFIVSANLVRRHQTQSQRAMSAARLTTLRGPGRPGKNASTEALSQSEAAGAFGIGRATVQRAVAILGDTILAPAVDAGRVTVSAAYAIRGESDDAKKLAVTAVSRGEAPTLQAALKGQTVIRPAGSAQSGGPVARGSDTADRSEPSTPSEAAADSSDGSVNGSTVATEPGPKQRRAVPKEPQGLSDGEAGGAATVNADSPSANDSTALQTGNRPDLGLQASVSELSGLVDRLGSIVAEYGARGIKKPRLQTATRTVLRLLLAMVECLERHADDDLPAQLECSMQSLLALDVVDHKHAGPPPKETRTSQRKTPSSRTRQ